MTSKSLLVLILLSFGSLCNAGVYTDNLSRCLVQSTTEKDKELLVKWIFVAMSKHPVVASFSSISKESADLLNQETSKLFVSLLAISCKNETKEALKNEGAVTIETSFGVLGEVAMGGIMGHKNVDFYLSEMSNHIDFSDLEDVFKEIKQ